MNNHLKIWLIQIIISLILCSLTIFLIKKNSQLIFLQTLSYNKFCKINQFEKILDNFTKAQIVYKPKLNINFEKYFYEHIVNNYVGSKNIFFIVDTTNIANKISKEKEKVIFIYKNYKDINDDNNIKNINLLISINKKCNLIKQNVKKITNVRIEKVESIKIINVNYYFLFIFYLLLIRYLCNLRF
jgi:hypothetical protein